MKYLFLLLFYLNFLISIQCQTIISNDITSDTTWSQINSPFIIQDSITIFPNVILNIDPGVEIAFNQQSMLKVLGSLKAIGTINDTIRFTSTSINPVSGIYYGIYISNATDSVNFSYCKFQYALWAIYQAAGTDQVKICNHSSFIENGYGIIMDSVGIVDSCYFEHNGTAIQGVNKVNYSTFIENYFAIHNATTIINSIFCGNSNAIGLVYGKLANCIITNNHYGVFSAYADSVYDNYIYKNDYGIQFPTSSFIYNNSFCKNGVDVLNKGMDTIFAQNNCWCDTDSINISNKIYDMYDDITLGPVIFAPHIICDTSMLPSTIYCTTNISGINNEFNEEQYKINIFPNPFSYETQIVSEQFLQDATIEIHSMFNQKMTIITSFYGHKITLNREKLMNGIYILRIIQDNKVVGINKIIVIN